MTIEYLDHATVTHQFQEETGDGGGSEKRPVHGLPAAVRTNFTDMVTALQTLAGIVSATKAAVTDATTQGKLDTLHTDVGTTLAGYLSTLAGIVSAAVAAVSDASTHTKLDTLHTDVGTTLAGYLNTLAGIVSSARANVNVDSTTTGKLDTIHTDLATLTGTVTSSRVAVNVDSTTTGKLDTIHTDLATLTGTVTSSRVAVNVDSTTTGKLDTLHTDIAPPATIYNGKTTVTTHGTRVTLASSQALVKGVWIKALTINTQLIYVGSSAVTSSNGYQLSAGEAVFLEVANLNTVNIDSDVNGEGVTYVAT